MKKFNIEYTTEQSPGQTFFTTVTAADYTKAYLLFVFAFPVGHLIISILEA